MASRPQTQLANCAERCSFATGYHDPMTFDVTSGRTVALFWLPVVVWAGVIFAFSATPNLRVAQAADVDFVIRKAGHMFVFGVLAVLIWRALAYSAVRRAMLWSLALTVAYATTDEFHQSFTAGRHPSPVDVGIDSVGALLSLLALTLWLKSWRARVGPRPGHQD
jgi:VanZ family protein